MTQLIHAIKKIGMFLFGVIVIALGYNINNAQAQTKPEQDANTVKAQEASAPEATQDKASAKTTTEKAKPEKAHASKYKKKKAGSSSKPGPRSK